MGDGKAKISAAVPYGLGERAKKQTRGRRTKREKERNNTPLMNPADIFPQKS
jgi:hypothetical protein